MRSGSACLRLQPVGGTRAGRLQWAAPASERTAQSTVLTAQVFAAIMHKFTVSPVACALALLAGTAVAGGAELYKWVDENGVVNYSNTPPPKTAKGKPPTIVDEQISVYTPDPAVIEEIERNQQKIKQKPAPVASTVEPERPTRASTLSPPAAVSYDPCANPNDRNCPGVIYDSSPVFHGRRRPLPPLVQPQLPPGTIAGQGAGPGAYIPGQSGTARTLPAPPRRSQNSSVRSREPEREDRAEHPGFGHTRGR